MLGLRSFSHRHEPGRLWKRVKDALWWATNGICDRFMSPADRKVRRFRTNWRLRCPERLSVHQCCTSAQRADCLLGGVFAIRRADIHRCSVVLTDSPSMSVRRGAVL